MPAAAHAVVRRGRPARPHRVCPPAEGAVPPPPHLAEQQVLARRCSTGFLLEDGGLIARVSYARPRLSLSAAHTDARLGTSRERGVCAPTHIGHTPLLCSTRGLAYIVV